MSSATEEEARPLLAQYQAIGGASDDDNTYDDDAHEEFFDVSNDVMEMWHSTREADQHPRDDDIDNQSDDDNEVQSVDAAADHVMTSVADATAAGEAQAESVVNAVAQPEVKEVNVPRAAADADPAAGDDVMVGAVGGEEQRDEPTLNEAEVLRCRQEVDVVDPLDDTQRHR